MNKPFATDYLLWAHPHGFSLKEMLMSLAAISLLFAIFIPTFFMLQNSVRQTELKKILNLVSASTLIQTQKPLLLDQNLIGDCKSCFDAVLPVNKTLKIQNKYLKKVAENIYAFCVSSPTQDTNLCRNPGDWRIEYRPQTAELLVFGW